MPEITPKSARPTFPNPTNKTFTFFMPTPTPRAANVIPNPPLPEIQVLSTTVNGDGDIVINWTAENGKTYRVQYKDDLNASTWSDLSDITASGAVASTTEVIGAGSQRFYRIQLLIPMNSQCSE